MPPSVKKVFQFQSPSWAFTALGCDCSVTILPPQRSVPGVNWGSFNQSALRPNPLARLAFIRRRVVTLRLFVRVSVWTKRPLFLYLFRLRFFYDITFVRAPVKNISTSQGGKKEVFLSSIYKKKGGDNFTADDWTLWRRRSHPRPTSLFCTVLSLSRSIGKRKINNIWDAKQFIYFHSRRAGVTDVVDSLFPIALFIFYY